MILKIVNSILYFSFFQVTIWKRLFGRYRNQIIQIFLPGNYFSFYSFQFFINLLLLLLLLLLFYFQIGRKRLEAGHYLSTEQNQALQFTSQFAQRRINFQGID